MTNNVLLFLIDQNIIIDFHYKNFLSLVNQIIEC